MAGGQLWGVWAQTITNDTTAANVEKYGGVEDMAEAYRDGFAKDFCDGQTSPTPPRWPDDGMQLLYFYDRESAELVSQFLRGNVVERMQGGDLQPTAAPSWLADVTAAALDTAEKSALFAAVYDAADASSVVSDMTESQLSGRLAAYIQATGNPKPTAAELLAWIERQG